MRKNKFFYFCFFAFALLFTSSKSWCQNSIFGEWNTYDDETGKKKSTVEIYKKGSKAYGKVIDLQKDNVAYTICKKCTGEDKDKPIVGLEIIKDMEKDDDVWKDGTILDPKNGKVYSCKIWLENDSTLMVRGYVSFFFRTQTWRRN